jgi:hypothetical protein
MRKAVVALAGAGLILLGAAVPAGALEEPPRGSCNSGTMHAHETVPHETAGNHVAHSHIPHCP